MTRKFHPGKALCSFTLLELLVSIVILSILVIALFSILGGTEFVWQHGQSEIEQRQNARTILDYIGQDLRSAQLPSNLHDTNNLQFVVNPDATTGTSTPASGTYFNPQAAFWQVSREKVVSGILSHVMEEVGYFVRWDTTTNPNNPRATLCRLSIPAVNSTGQANSNFLILPVTYTSSGTTTTTTASPSAWITGPILDNVAPGNAAGSYQGWFADNVIAIWIRCLDSNGNTIVLRGNTAQGATYAPYCYDSRQGYRYTPLGSTTALIERGGNVVPMSLSPGTTQSEFLATLPASVEIALVILSSRGAAQLTAIPTYTVTTPSAATPDAFWTDITTFVNGLPPNIKKQAFVYSSQIQIETRQP